jgi:hypothetical protein
VEPVKAKERVMALYAVLAIGVGNVGRNQNARRPMPEWVETLNKLLSEGQPPVQVVGSFGHTGNFIAGSPSNDLPQISARFHNLLSTDWVVRSADDMRFAWKAVMEAVQPPNKNGIRWTPGLALHGEGGIDFHTIVSTPRAVLWKISPFAIGVWKHDNLGASGVTLDRERRGGGWGAVSHDITRQIGGRWTSRSLRTVEALVRHFG